MAHVHESPWVMLGPLVLLAVGAVCAGFVAYGAFVGDGWAEFWGASIFIHPDHHALENAHHSPTWVVLLPFVMGVAGIALAWWFYIKNPSLPGRVAGSLRPLYLFSFNKWYFDELYDRIFVRPAFHIGWGFWKGGDGAVIDGVGPDGIAAATRDLARKASRLQTGYVYHYAFAMLVGVVILISWYLYRQGL